MYLKPAFTRSPLIWPLKAANALSFRRLSPSICKRYQTSSITDAMLLQKNIMQVNSMQANRGTESIHCTVFDKFGNIDPNLGKMKRDDLITIHGLLPRDLRKIEKSRQNDLVPTLLVREKCILISLLTYKALVKSNMVIIFNSIGDSRSLPSTTQKLLINDLQIRLKNKFTNELGFTNLPFEFRALEGIFTSALSNLTSELKLLLTMSEGILSDLETDITRYKLRLLLIQNKKLSIFSKKVSLFKETIDDILEQDDVLCDMYLSDKELGIEHRGDDHADLEMLLETYYSYINEIVQMTESAINNVKTTEEIINIILDSNRNSLMLLGIKFSVSMLSLCGAIFIGSAYGMNLENFIEETNYGFSLTIILGCIFSISLYVAGIRELHRLQKVSIMNHFKKK